MHPFSIPSLREKFDLHIRRMALFGAPETPLALQAVQIGAPVMQCEGRDAPAAGANVVIIDRHSGARAAEALVGADPSALDAAFVDIDPADFASALDEWDLLFFDLGLFRVSTETSRGAPVWSLLYIRSALISDVACIRQPRMHDAALSGFGGRFANQMFQYVFVTLYGLRSNCAVIAPEFEGHALFDLPFAPGKSKPLPLMNFGDNHADADVMLDALHPPRNVMLRGYFQHITRAHRLHRTFIRAMLRPRPAIAAPLSDWLAEVRARFPRVMGLHIRRGDYRPYDPERPHKFTQVPTAWYRDWIAAHGRLGPNDALLISTDDRSVLKEFAGFPLVQDKVPLPAGLDPRIADLYGLGACDTALYCNSSWSFLAGLMAKDGQEAFMVDIPGKTFKPFDPWATQDFWQPFETVRPLHDRPLRGGDRVSAEQRFLDHWKAEAELALCLQHPARHLLRSMWEKLFGNHFTRKMIHRMAPPRWRQSWSIGAAKAHIRRRARRYVVARRPIAACEAFDKLERQQV